MRDGRAEPPVGDQAAGPAVRDGADANGDANADANEARADGREEPEGPDAAEANDGREEGREDGRVTRARRLRTERREQVRAVARRLFAERGYHEASIQDILDGAGIARGTFYLYFDGKRAIFNELVDDFLDRIRAVVRRVDVSPGAEPPLLQIEQNLARVMRALLDNREMTRIILHQAEGLDKDCDAKMADFYDRLLRLLGSALESGQRMGLIRPCDARVVAQAALGSMKEVVLQWIVRPGRPSAPADLDHVIRELLTFSLKGLFNG